VVTRDEVVHDTAPGGEASGMIVMMVRDVMTPGAMTIGPDTPCHELRRMMDEHRVRHLPVVIDGRVVGMVSDRDVRSAPSGSSGAVAGRIMTPDPVTVTPETRIEDAAQAMLDGRFGSLPVVADEAMVGIVTYTDLLRAFVRVLETATLERITVEVAGGA
jgi:acetoin utilization protein AcuB